MGINRGDMVGMVSPFPEKGQETTSFSALAGYTKTLLQSLGPDYRKRYVILAQRSNTEKEFVEDMDGFPVSYVWRYDNPLFFIDIISEVIRLKLKIVHIQHEVFVFGKKQHIYPYLCIVMVAILRLLSVKVVCTIHGVVSARNVSEDFSKSNKVVAPLFLIRIGLSLMYKLTCAFSNVVIVHNEKLSNVLQEEYSVNKDKVYVVPHPLYKYTSLGKKPSVFKSLPVGKKTVLFFGFLAPYKGLDTLIEAAISNDVKKDDNIVFLVVGSTPKRYTDDASYLSWLNGLKKLSLGNKNIIWVHDYIPDEEVGDYFKNSDLIVIPYNEAMSASGPLSIAIYYEKPVLVSKPFSGVVQEGLVYGRTSEELAYSIRNFFMDSSYKASVECSVKEQKSMWSDDVIDRKMGDIIAICTVEGDLHD